MLESHKKPHPNLPKIGMAGNFDKTQRDTDNKSIDRYKESLSEQQITDILTIVGSKAKELGYDFLSQ